VTEDERNVLLKVVVVAEMRGMCHIVCWVREEKNVLS